MLKLLRSKHIMKAIFWALVILILPAFVLFGTGSIGRPSGEKGPSYAGTIDNKKVTFDEFADSITSLRCQITLNLFNQPQVLEAILKNKPLMGKMAWDRLIMAREAAKLKIKVKNDEVVTYIRSHPIFARGGRFDDNIYGYVLKNNFGLYPRNFEEIVRESLVIKKSNDLITKDVKAADEKDLEKKKNEFLEEWLRKRESAAKANIDFNDYEKYYR